MASAPSQQDPLTSMMEMLTLSNQPEAEFEAEVAEFPHSFLMQDQGKMGISQLRRVKSGLESALAVGYKTSMETARARNLLAYVLCRLDESDDALKELDKVLDMEDQANNVVTLANKAFILWRQCELSMAWGLVERLRQMKTEDSDFQYRVIKAKTELAFSYTRFGPSFACYAITLFEEVISQAREPELWLWTFGLGLTKRRAHRANPHSVSTAPSKDFADENWNVLHIFLRVVRNCRCPHLRAKANAEIATILFNVSKTPLRKEFFDMAGMSTTKACDTALELDSRDKSALCKCGIVLRRCCPERARHLLEESLRLRESSRAHHHLALMYKRLATEEKYKDSVKTPGYYEHLAQQRSQSVASSSTDDTTSHTRTESTDSPHATDISTGIERITVGPPLSLNRDTRNKQKMIKSPPGNVTRFSRTDKYVKEALYHLERAIQVSEGENVRAIYDLALLQRSLGELEAAKETLMSMGNQPPTNLLPFDHINMYEQMGQVLMELAEDEEDEQKKKHLLQDSRSMLLTALKGASRIFKFVKVQEHPGEIFSSLAILFKRAEDTEDKAEEIKEKAMLMELIRKYRPFLQLLQQLETLDPQIAQDPKHQKRKIEGHVNLGEFVEAAVLLEVLTDKSNVTQLRQLFGDKQYVLKVHLKAARQVLIRGLPAKEHFKSAFHEFVLCNTEETSSSEFEDPDTVGSTKNPWNVVVVYDKSAGAEAKALISVLETICGLTAPDIDLIIPANKPEPEEQLTMVRNSNIAVVLAGGKLSDKMRILINGVAKRLTTVTLLVEGDKVPFLLQENRSLPCDASLLQRLRSAAEGGIAEPEAEAIFQIVNFLFNVEESPDSASL